MSKLRRSLALLLCALSLGVPVRAEAARPLKGDLRVDATVTVSLLALWLSSEGLFKAAWAPETCRWCDRDQAGDRLNSLDRWGRGMRGAPGQLPLWDGVSNVAAFALVPAGVLGTEAVLAARNDSLRGWPADLLLIVEATSAALVLNQGVKLAAGRERPFVHALPPSERSQTPFPLDNNLSFFSGHSTFAFALTAATATIAELRGYRGAPWVWVLGLPLATAVPLLRMAADRHYLSDVLVGAAVGTACGIGVPRLFHQADVQVSAGPGGISVAGAL